MKTTIIARTGAVFLGLLILVLFQVTTSHAARQTYASRHSSTPDSCADEGGIFQTSVFTRIFTRENGTFTDFELRLSSKDGNCSTLLYSSSAARNSVRLAPRDSSQDLMVALN